MEMSETSETIHYIELLPYLMEISSVCMNEYFYELTSQLETSREYITERIERMKNNSP